MTVPGYSPMVCRSDAMKRLVGTIVGAAETNASVVISGESGSGKGLAASAIHACSPRRAGPYVVVNCHGMSPSRLRAELWGQDGEDNFEEGASKGGQIEAANGGTLFLHEIEGMPFDLKLNLFRCVREGSIKRPGARKAVPIDVRLILATHDNLEHARQGPRLHFDLDDGSRPYPVHVPPLRERRDDIQTLAHHILHKFRHDSPRTIRGIGGNAIEALQTYRWPENVRELISRLRYAISIGEGEDITASDLGLEGYLPLNPSRLAALYLMKRNPGWCR